MKITHDEELLRFLSGIDVQPPHLGRHCALCTVPTVLGGYRETECFSYCGPQLTLAVIYPQLRYMDVTYKQLIQLPRESVDRLSRAAHLSPSQHAALSSMLPMYLETAAVTPFANDEICAADRTSAVLRCHDRQTTRVVLKSSEEKKLAIVHNTLAQRQSQLAFVSGGVAPLSPKPPPPKVDSSRKTLRVEKAVAQSLWEQRHAARRNQGLHSGMDVVNPLECAAIIDFSFQTEAFKSTLMPCTSLVDLKPMMTKTGMVKLGAESRGESSGVELFWQFAFPTKTPKPGKLSHKCEQFVSLESFTVALDTIIDKLVFFRSIFRRLTVSSKWYVLQDELDGVKHRVTKEQVEAVSKIFEEHRLSVLSFSDVTTALIQHPELLAPFCGLIVEAIPPITAVLPPKKKKKKKRSSSKKHASGRARPFTM